MLYAIQPDGHSPFTIYAHFNTRNTRTAMFSTEHCAMTLYAYVLNAVLPQHRHLHNYDACSNRLRDEAHALACARLVFMFVFSECACAVCMLVCSSTILPTVYGAHTHTHTTHTTQRSRASCVWYHHTN